jgi:hypothetical protein
MKTVVIPVVALSYVAAVVVVLGVVLVAEVVGGVDEVVGHLCVYKRFVILSLQQSVIKFNYLVKLISVSFC